MHVELTDAERRLLQEVLEGRMAELRQEVRHARVASFREELKQREDVLRGLINKLDEMVTA